MKINFTFFAIRLYRKVVFFITLGVSLLDYMVRGAIQKYGEWSTAFLKVDDSFVQERSQDKEVTGTVTLACHCPKMTDGTAGQAQNVSGMRGISVLSVFLVIFATMMYAVSKIRRENIIDALRDEMT